MNDLSPAGPAAPSTPADWLHRVDTLRVQGQIAQALNVVLPRLRQGKVDVQTLDRAAMCFFDLGDGAAAIGLLELLTQSSPTLPAGWAKLALMRESTGDKAGAIRDYGKALKCDPDLISALHSLGKLRPYPRGGQQAKRLRRLCKSKGLTPSNRALVLNSLGQIEHRAKRPKSAFRYYAQSKDAVGGSYKPAAIDALVDDQVARFQKVPAPASAPKDPRVVFVCGMPRSGTTLVENILLRHSRVDTIGESKALKTVLKTIRQHIAGTDRGQNYWDWFGQLSPDEITAFRQVYFAAALQGRVPSGDVIVDKMPLNCLDIGLAHVLLPNAQFVFLSRHPLDTALSCFATCFSDGVAFSRRLDWIGHLTQAVYRSVQDYAAKLGAQVQVQSYRALVSHPEQQIHQMLDRLDLPWEPSCLSPERNTLPSRTASSMQVRQKINTEALDKWRPFADQLAPVVEGLGGPAWIDAWEARDGAILAAL